MCVDVVSEQKRVKLLMQVFHSTDIARDESVAVVKFRVWWHFVVALKDKATALFDTVLLLVKAGCLCPVIRGQRIRGFTSMRYINQLFTYLLTYAPARREGGSKRCFCLSVHPFVA